MRTRTFIGLILLVAALIVASTPALLTPTANGVEHLGIEAGVLHDQEKLAKKREREREKQEQVSGVTVDPHLELKGFVEEMDGDLRDTQPVGERDVNVRGRLEAGSQRLLVPGQKSGTDAYSPPFSAEDGVLLDIDGCPVFRPEADVASMMANAEIRTRYLGKVTTSNDAAACRAVFEDRVAIATAVDTDPTTGADRRRLAGLEYESFASLGITVQEYDMLMGIFDFGEMPAALEEATTGAAGTATGATTSATSAKTSVATG